MKANRLPVKKKVHITPAQQMLNRFEALQKAASNNSSAAVMQSSGADAMKQSASRAVVNNTADQNSAKVPCANKPKLGNRVAHKPVLVRL